MKLKKNKGLTLLEVIISLAILGIIIAPILSMTLTTVKTSKKSEDKIFAANLAQQCTEYIKSAVIINDSFLGSLQSDVGLKKISLADINDNRNLADIKEIFKDKDIDKCYLYNLKDSYKNIIAEIEYETISDVAKDEYSDIKNYDMLIDIADVIGIKDTDGMELYKTATLDTSKGNVDIEVRNTDDKLSCSIKQGDTVLCNNIEVTKQKNLDVKKEVRNVKIILKGTEVIKFNIKTDNEIPSNIFAIDFLKEVKSQYTYFMLTNGSSNIKTNYKTFDNSSNQPDKLVRKNTFNIQIWNCDFKNNTKNLLQEIITTKVM